MFDINYSKAFAELNIFSRKMDIETVSEILKMKVDYIRKKGDYSSQKDNTVYVSPAYSDGEIICWTYKAQENKTLNLSAQLDDIIAVFSERICGLKKIKKIYDDCEFVICIVLSNHQSELPAISLSEEQISFIAEIGAKLDFDIYNNWVLEDVEVKQNIPGKTGKTGDGSVSGDTGDVPTVT